MKKTWYLIIGVVLLVIGCIAYGYHEHHKPKTAQELKTVRVAYLPITHALPVFATKRIRNSRWSCSCRALLNMDLGQS